MKHLFLTTPSRWYISIVLLYTANLLSAQTAPPKNQTGLQVIHYEKHCSAVIQPGYYLILKVNMQDSSFVLKANVAAILPDTIVVGNKAIPYNAIASLEYNSKVYLFPQNASWKYLSNLKPLTPIAY